MMLGWCEVDKCALVFVDFGKDFFNDATSYTFMNFFGDTYFFTCCYPKQMFYLVVYVILLLRGCWYSKTFPICEIKKKMHVNPWYISHLPWKNSHLENHLSFIKVIFHYFDRWGAITCFLLGFQINLVSYSWSKFSYPFSYHL